MVTDDVTLMFGLFASIRGLQAMQNGCYSVCTKLQISLDCNKSICKVLGLCASTKATPSQQTRGWLVVH